MCVITLFIIIIIKKPGHYPVGKVEPLEIRNKEEKGADWRFGR